MKKSPEQIMRECEANYAVENITYEGLPLWPFLRTIFLHEVSFTEESSGQCTGEKIKLLKWKNFCRHMHGVLYTNYFLFFKRGTILLFTSNHQFRKVDNKIMNQLTGYLEEKLENVIPVVQIDIDKKNKMYGRNYIDQRFIDDLIRFKAKKNLIDKKTLHGEDILLDVIQGLKIQYDYLTYISVVIHGIEYYTKWFRYSKPKFLIVECFYDMKMQAIYAAKNLGITVIELQHGMIHKGNFAYYCRKNFSVNPYPDWLFGYGEMSKEEIKNGKIYEEDKIIPVGNYYLTIMEERKEINKKLFYDKYSRILGKKIIVVASQITVDRKLYEITNKIARKLKDFAVIFVPRIIEKYHKSNEKVGFYLEDKLDIYQLMQNADVMINVHSTCAVESLFLGTPVLLWDIEGLASGYYGEILRGLNSVCFVDKFEDGLLMIKRLSEIDREDVKKEGRIFYKSNYKENIDNALERIV